MAQAVANPPTYNINSKFFKRKSTSKSNYLKKYIPLNQTKSSFSSDGDRETKESKETSRSKKSSESNEEQHKIYLAKPENEPRIKSKIWHFRAFINYAKSYMMQIGMQSDNKGPKLGIDMGCYKGGDLKKWLHCNVDQLIMVENYSDECFNRYLLMRQNRPWFFVARYLKNDFTKDDVVPDEKVHMISSQMSLHRAFESEAQVKKMVDNIARSLRPGGKFVASFTSAVEVLKKVTKSADRTSFGNSLYQIKFPTPVPNEIPKYGYKFKFIVDDYEYEEYLVNPDILIEELNSKGVKLIDIKPLKNWNIEAKKYPKQIESMERVDVGKLMTGPNDEKIFKFHLSSEELEIVDLYDSAVFQKDMLSKK